MNTRPLSGEDRPGACEAADAVRLLSCPDPASLLVTALELCLPVARDRAGLLFRLHEGWLRLTASTGFSPDRLEPFRVMSLEADQESAQAARERRPVCSVARPGAPPAPAGPLLPEPGTAYLALPVITDGDCLGVLSLVLPDGPPSAEDVRRMSDVATLCAHRWNALLARVRRLGSVAGSGRPARDDEAEQDPQDPQDPQPMPTRVLRRVTMLELAMSHARIGTFDWDFGSGRMMWDERMCELFGIRPQDFDGRVETFHEAVHPADRQIARDAVEESRSTGSFHVHLRIRRPDGQVRWLELESRVVFDRVGEARSMVGVAQDRTAEHEREATEAARQARKDFILRLTRGLTAAQSIDDITQTVAATALPELGASSLMVFLFDEHGVGELVACHGLDEAAVAQLRRSAETADRRALEPLLSGDPLFCETRDDYVRVFPAPELAPAPGWGSCAILPLSAGERLIGACAVGYGQPRTFSPDDRTVLTAAAGALAQAFARAQLFDSRRRYLTELQRLMLPGRLPRLAGLEVAARYRPGSSGLEVGGDWYDVLELPNGRVAMVIGDVQGHSARAAAVMGQLRTVMRTQAVEGHGPGVLMARANDTLCELETELFATCCLVEVDRRQGTVRSARAGHPCPLLISGDGQVREIDADGGIPLGFFPGEEYPVITARLPSDCTLLMYSDGLVERPGTDYTDAVDQLAERLAWWAGTSHGTGQVRPLDLDLIADRLVSPAITRPQHDDIALLLLRSITATRGHDA
jgi:PAS domain S-box-containing protein